MLTDRQKLILKAIIEEYVRTNEPVGSKALVDKPYLAFSSATIRYEMQHLEETGYLKKTHTSSGRVPSEKGYRYYVDHLVIRDNDVAQYYKFVDEIMDDPYLNKEEIFKRLAKFISDLTGYYSMVTGTPNDLAQVLKLEIVPLNDAEAVLLVVTSAGNVQSEKINIPNGYKIDDLMRIIQMFDNAMYGHSVYEIKDVLSREAAKPRIRQMVDFQDDLLNFMIKAFSRLLNGEAYDSGLLKLFSQPEFQDHNIMKKIIKAIDENIAREYAKINQMGLKIHIGSEISCDGMEDCTIISMPFVINENEIGTIIVIGPTRMNYRASIPLLEYIAKSMIKLNKRKV